VLSFTGSDVVGWKLKSLAGKKQVLLELGGNAPCIVCDDADLETALPKIIVGAWANSGQVCIKVQRVLVAESRFAEFLERFVAATAKVKCGDPADEQTIVGPLIEPRHVERVLSWIAAAVADGATMHCGGKAQGQVVLPTILTGAPADSHVVCDEVFGPVTVVEPFATLDDAIAMCNASRFGLQAGLFTNRLDDMLRAYRELEYGGVIVGDVPTFRVDNFPYGGVKDSGLGREGVRYAIEEMTEPRVLVM
jgi:acyl-CoA reductase-like NAD-dependent aldehyde dehydrogenase